MWIWMVGKCHIDWSKIDNTIAIFRTHRFGTWNSFPRLVPQVVTEDKFLSFKVCITLYIIRKLNKLPCTIRIGYPESPFTSLK